VRVSGSGQPVHLLLDIVEVLRELRIPYALVGGLAVSFYGTPRSTNDADTIIWLEKSGKTRKDLETSLASHHYITETRIGDVGDPVSGVIAVKDSYENRLDLLLGIRGLQAQAFTRTKSTTIFGATIDIIGCEDLIAMKTFAGGVQDLEDVRGILAVSGELLDFELLRNIADHYGQPVAQKLDAMLKDSLP